MGGKTLSTEFTVLHELMSYVDTGEAEWIEVEPGYRRLPLISDRSKGTRITMVEYSPGYQLSRVDEHAHDEYLYIVSGTFVDQHRASGPGTFIHNKPGSSHQPSSPDGCTFIAVITTSPPAGGSPSAS